MEHYVRFLIFSSVTLVVLVIIFLGYGQIYSKDKAKLRIDDFTEIQVVELEPHEFNIYTMKNIWIEGYVNDTILIKLNSAKEEPILRLSGKISKRWYSDYYGEGTVKFIFDPYKATEGELEIEFSL